MPGRSIKGVQIFVKAFISRFFLSKSSRVSARIDEPVTKPDKVDLIWHDEFDLNGLPNARKWAYDTSRNYEGWWNHEQQYYAKARLKNTYIKNGVLHILAYKEELSPKIFRDWGRQAYSSGKIVTQWRFEFRYGYVEVRAKMPCHRGSWPAIWMLPAPPHTQWPGDGEIDILEHVGWDPHHAYQTVHTQDHYFINNTQQEAISDILEACNQFHIYSALWTEDAVKLGFDGRYRLRYLNDHKGRRHEWPFDSKLYLILNLAVGGDFGGKKGIDVDSFPWDMQVDYVRIYKEPKSDL